MACTALEQKLKYHAKKQGYTIRKFGDSYTIADVNSKKIIAGFLSLDELKAKILSMKIKNLENNFARSFAILQ